MRHRAADRNSEHLARGNRCRADDATNTLKPFRAYFMNSNTDAHELMFTVDGDVTGISEIEKMRDGENETFFNLAGQRVAQPTKGLYIVNGKKIIIK